MEKRALALTLLREPFGKAEIGPEITTPGKAEKKGKKKSDVEL